MLHAQVFLVSLLSALCAGCDGKDSASPPESTDTGIGPDLDGDGFTPWQGDCDDDDPEINPAAEELCDGIDNDCDFGTDEGSPADAPTWYADADADGWGDEGSTQQACNAPSGYVADAGDCDDGSADTHPEADELCDDIDNDCDDEIDEDPTDAPLWYADDDGDGYGGSTDTLAQCEQPLGYADNKDDCDDASSDVHPGATEICLDGVDNDCDGMGGACLDGDISLGLADAILSGESVSAYLGTSAAMAGDLDGDGLADLLMSAPGADPGASDAGAAYVMLGTLSLDDTTAEAYTVFSGASGGDQAGTALAGAGDVNGDGFPDMLFGAPYNDDGDRDAGATHVVLGPPAAGSSSLASADATLMGESAHNYAGYAISGAGDTNGDGLDDVIIGAYQADAGATDAGSAYLAAGPITGAWQLGDASARVTGAAANDNLGWAVAGGGDMNGDGLSDILAGAYMNDENGSNAGAAYLFTGPLTAVYNAVAADASYWGEAQSDFAGFSLALDGDVDGDGYDDLLISSSGEDSVASDAGAVYVVLGAPAYAANVDLSQADAKLIGEESGDRAGFSVGFAGDVDGDGIDDLLVGARGLHADSDAQPGGAYLLYGPVQGEQSLAEASARLQGEGDGSYGGYVVTGGGDMDGDGYDDFAIGAPQADAGYSDAGVLYILHARGEGRL